MSEKLNAVGNPFLDGQSRYAASAGKGTPEERLLDARRSLPRILEVRTAGGPALLGDVLRLGDLLHEGLVEATGLRSTALLEGKEVKEQFVTSSF